MNYNLVYFNNLVLIWFSDKRRNGLKNMKEKLYLTGESKGKWYIRKFKESTKCWVVKNKICKRLKVKFIRKITTYVKFIIPLIIILGWRTKNIFWHNIS